MPLYLLQGKAQELAQAMAARDGELAALKAQLAAISNGAGATSSDGHSSGTAHDEAEAEVCLPERVPYKTVLYHPAGGKFGFSCCLVVLC